MIHHSPHLHDLLERLSVPNTTYQYTHQGFARVTLAPLSPAALRTQTAEILRAALRLERPDLTLPGDAAHLHQHPHPVVALPFTLLHLIPDGESQRLRLADDLRRAARVCTGAADAETELRPAAAALLGTLTPDVRLAAGRSFETLAELLTGCPAYLDTPLNRARRAYRQRGGYAEVTTLMDAEGVPFPAPDAPTLTLTEAGGAVYDAGRTYHRTHDRQAAHTLAQAWTAYHAALRRTHACYAPGQPGGTCQGLSWDQNDNRSGGVCPHCQHWTPETPPLPPQADTSLTA